MILSLAIANYRSLRDLVIPLGQLTLITGANGAGKSSVYRSLRLLAETAQGGIIPTLALEGGLPSTLWAGPETLGRKVLAGEQAVEGTVRSRPIHLRLGFATEDFGYAIDLGLPPPIPPSAFNLDPEIKREVLFAGERARPGSILIDRQGPSVRVRDEANQWRALPIHLAPFEGLMTHCVDPVSTPELLRLRERIRAWRFYDHFRTDALSPARQVHVGTRTPVLAHDGSDLGAAIQTIFEIGDEAGFATTIDDAFPGSAIEIGTEHGRFAVQMRQRGLLRPLAASELSDGTLRYLLLATALMSPRPPELLILNEPETSLHPDLLPALARLIIQASSRSQVIVVSHSNMLIAGLEAGAACTSIELEKQLGETRVCGAGPFDSPAWTWPAR